MSIRIYKDVHVDFIRQNYYLCVDSIELTHKFNQEFNMNVSAPTIRSLCKRNGFYRNNQNVYTKEQDEWMKRHHESKSVSNLVKDFNIFFNLNISANAYGQRCRHIGLKYKNPTIFGNKIAWNKSEIESERVDPKTGYTEIKNQKGKWINKARYLYEKHIGEVTNKEQVIQIDGNKNNFELSNLVKVSKQYMLMLNRNNWLGKDEISKTAIKYCELHYKLLEKEGK